MSANVRIYYAIRLSIIVAHFHHQSPHSLTQRKNHQRFNSFVQFHPLHCSTNHQLSTILKRKDEESMIVGR